MIQRLFTLVADTPDFRDVAFSDVVVVDKPSPAAVDLRSTPFLSPVKDQGHLGSCTANAGTSIVEFARRKAGLDAEPLSRLMYYYGERTFESSIDVDQGAQIRDGIKFMAKTGCCVEAMWPYNISHFATEPAARCFEDGAENKIGKYARLTGLDDMVNCLAAGHPFTFGFSVYESFQSSTVAQTGLVPMPQRTERLLGGHAVYAIGYDKAAQRFIVRNSWGTRWGIAGDCLMPFEYLGNANLCADVWTVLP